MAESSSLGRAPSRGVPLLEEDESLNVVAGPGTERIACTDSGDGLEARLGLPLALCLAILCVQSFGGVPAPGALERAMIDREVLEAVHDGGARVLVEVGLPGDMKPEGELTAAAALAQRRAIAAAQNSVLSRLAGSHFSLIRRYETVPLLLLEIHGDALTALARMDDVVARVRLDIPKAPAVPGAAR